VYRNEDGQQVINNASANNTDMKVYALIDTTTPSLWALGLYDMYVKLTVTPEVPRLGPFKFRVDK
jgi:hypothetical protein